MLKNLMTATAMVALFATGAVAADNNANTNAAAPAATNPAPTNDANMLANGYQPMTNDNLASHLIGAPVFASNDPNADQIGDVNDLVVNSDGTVAAIVVGVGGFLGVGEKNVAMDYSSVQQTMGPDNKPRLIVNTTKDALNAAPTFEWNNDQTASVTQGNGPTNSMSPNAPAPADNSNMAANTNANATNPNANGAAPADNTNMAANTNANATTPNATPAAPADNTNVASNANANNGANANANGMAATDNTNVAATNPNAVQVPPYNSTDLKDVTLTAEQLVGTNAYGPNDQHLGTIGDVVLGDDSKSVQAVVIDFGGFLGIGTKPVAVDISNLRVAQDQNGNDYVYINVTRDQLDQAVAFNADTFKTQKDQQLLQTQPLS